MNLSELGIPVELPKYSPDRLPIYKDWFTNKSDFIDKMVCEELLGYWFYDKTKYPTGQIILEPIDPIDRIFLSIFEEVFSSLGLPINWSFVCIRQDEIIIRYTTYSLTISDHSNTIKVSLNHSHARQKGRRVNFNCYTIHRICYRLSQLVNDFHDPLLTKTDIVKHTLFKIALELELLHVRRATLSYTNSIIKPQENS